MHTTNPLGGLTRPRRFALYAIAILVTLSTAVAFGESYRALYEWAVHHDVPYGWSLVWPAMVDVFVAVGELALFVGLTDRWATRHRVWAWCVTFGGLAASVAGNVGHVGSAQWTDRLTAAVPPVAAFVALTVAMGVLKRVVERAAIDVSDVPAATIPAPATATLETLDDSELARLRHQVALDQASSSAERVRYASDQCGSDRVRDVAAFLADHGHDAIPDETIMSTLRRKKRDSDSGPIPVVNGHAMNGRVPELTIGNN